MLKEVLKIIPKISNSDMTIMERLLNTRFGNVAKKFGNGLKSAMKFGVVASIGTAILDKILNPLKETEDALNRILTQGDDLVTYANEFGTTAGKLFKLQQLAKSTGLDEQSLYFLLMKFQNAVAEAESDRSKPSAVSEFIGRNDRVDAFFDFIQSLKKMKKSDQIIVQENVFGERQMLKMSEFLNADFAKNLKMIGARPAEEYTPALNRIANASDLNDALAAKRTMEDMLQKGQIINNEMIRSRDASERINLDRENQRLKSYDDIKNISDASNKILEIIEKLFLLIGNIANRLVNMSQTIDKIKESKWLRGLFGG